MGTSSLKLKALKPHKKIKGKDIRRLFKRYTKQKENPMKLDKFVKMMSELRTHLDYYHELNDTVIMNLWTAMSLDGYIEYKIFKKEVKQWWNKQIRKADNIPEILIPTEEFEKNPNKIYDIQQPVNWEINKKIRYFSSNIEYLVLQVESDNESNIIPRNKYIRVDKYGQPPYIRLKFLPISTICTYHTRIILRNVEDNEIQEVLLFRVSVNPKAAPPPRRFNIADYEMIEPETIYINS